MMEYIERFKLQARKRTLNNQIETWHEWKEDETYGVGDPLIRLFVDTLIEDYERLRFIVDSIPDDVWEDMRTWEAMEGVIE
jgi:hypothetical protein